MSRSFLVLARSASPALLLVAFACAQLSQTQSLGDVAREQKDTRKQHESNGKPDRILTNDDLAAGSVAVTSGTTSSSAASVGVQEPQHQESNGTASERQPVESKNVEGEAKDNLGGRSAVGSVLDRPKDSRPDVIVVPAGTELKVDIGEHKTVIPVRVGFATPIPALSQVTVEVTPSYFAIPYSNGGASYYADTPNVGYIEYATLTAITVEDKTYQLQTNSLPLSVGGTNSEVTFILGLPLKILR